MRSVRFGLVGVWVAGSALTILHALRPAGLAMYSPASTPVLQTIAAGGATLLAALSYGRWRQRQLAPHLITCAAFGVLAVSNVLFVLLPIIATPSAVSPPVRAAALVCGCLSAVLFMLATLVPER